VKLARALIIAVAALCVTQAQAQRTENVSVTGELPDVLTQTENRTYVLARILNLVLPADYRITEDCGSGRSVSVVAVIPYTPADPLSVAFAQGASQAYILRVAAKGCGPDRLHTIFAFPRYDAGPQLVNGYPGQTIADLQLRTDIGARLVKTMADSFNGGCPNVHVANTVVTHEGASGKPWMEEWTTRGCGQWRKFEVTFTPSPQGGTDYAARQVASQE